MMRTLGAGFRLMLLLLVFLTAGLVSTPRDAAAGCNARAFTFYENTVLKAYVAYYGRPADVGGLQWWAAELEKRRGDLAAIIDAFGNSAEFTDRYGGLDAQSLVNNLYRQLFGRDAEPAGLNWWVGELQSGRRPLTRIALDVLYGATGIDLTVMENRLAVARHYVTAAEELGGLAVEPSAADLSALISSVDATPASVEAACGMADALLLTVGAAGALFEEEIQAGSEATVGNLAKTGWELDIPGNAFGEDGSLSMRVLSENEAKNYQSGGFELYGTPTEIKLEGKENVRLGEPVLVTKQIPKDLLKDLAAEELFFALYYDGKWEYFSPDNVNLDKGTASVEVYHFSFLGFGKPTEEEQIKTYAKNYASLQWEKEKLTKKLTDSLSRQYDDLFDSIGVNDRSLRTQLTLDVITYLENEKLETGDMSPISTLANMANSISQGQAGMDDFRNQIIEFTGRALYRTLEKDPEKFASLANVTGGLSTAAGAISAGDTEGALQGIASVLRGAHPIVALTDTALTCVKESMEYGIELWTQNEIEKAYQIYIGNAAGKYGYETGLEGDFDTIFTLLGGGERQFQSNIVKKYCAKYGIEESILSEMYKDRIVANAMTYLKRTFDERKVADAEIAELQQEEEAFIGELKKQGLLDAYNYEKYFGMDRTNFNIGDRLVRLYKVKATVLGIMDKEVAAKISDDFLVKAINQWIFWSEQGDRAGFFKYMRDMGYIKEPYDVSPSYAWILVDVLDFENAEEWATADAHPCYAYTHSYSRGSYSSSVAYENGPGCDPYGQGLKGTFGLQAVFTGMPEIIYPDKPVSLHFSFTTTQNDVVKLSFAGAASADFDQWDLEPGGVTARARSFANADGKCSFVLDVNGNPSSYSETLTATLHAGKEGDRIALRTKFYIGVSMGTNYVYEWRRVD